MVRFIAKLNLALLLGHAILRTLLNNITSEMRNSSAYL